MDASENTVPEDPCRETVATFNKFASLYAEKYFSLSDYDRFYQRLADCIPVGGTVLDAACGPGNIAGFLQRVRPDISVTGVDLSENMIDQARQRVPTATFQVLDCRQLQILSQRFDGIAFAFGLNYLSDADAELFFTSLRTVLGERGSLLVSTITGEQAKAGFDVSSSGDRVYMVYRTMEQVLDLVTSHGFAINHQEVLPSPSNAPVPTRDLILLATLTARSR